jgi:tRNA dimethylallyltransferase
VGKTAVAIDVAQALGAEIISADSRQCYREMNIGVARPSLTELAAVPHHFIASHSIHEDLNAAAFEQYALQCLSSLFEQHHTAVMVGGTGLYVQAFCDGIDPMPVVSPEIRQQILAQYEQEGLPWLQEQVQQLDPAFWQVAEQQNPQRLMRALELKLQTGKSILAFRKGNKIERPFRIVKIGIDMDRPDLYERINQRVDMMMEMGLLDEAQSLYVYKHLNALQTVGYQEIFDYLDGQCTLSQAVEKIKQHSRNYAKRQLTWFKKDASIHWVHAGDIHKVEQILHMVRNPSIH